MACSAVRTHPCLNTHKVLYTPMGQPDSGLSPRHPFLPEGAALFRLDSEDKLGIAGGVFFINFILVSTHMKRYGPAVHDLTSFGS